MKTRHLLVHLSLGILLVFHVCPGRTKSNVSRVAKTFGGGLGSSGGGGGSYWARDTYADPSIEYSVASVGAGLASSSGYSGQINSFSLPSTDLNGGGGAQGAYVQNGGGTNIHDHGEGGVGVGVGVDVGGGGQYGAPAQDYYTAPISAPAPDSGSHGMLDAHTSYHTHAIDTEYKSSGGGGGNHGGGHSGGGFSSGGHSGGGHSGGGHSDGGYSSGGHHGGGHSGGGHSGGGHHKGSGYGQSHSYGYGVKPEAPVYKYKYHIIPHQHTTTEGWGMMTTKGKGGNDGWGWEEDYSQDNDGWGQDSGGSSSGNKGGGGGGLSGLAGLGGLAGIIGLLPLALLLIPLFLIALLLIPLPFFYFPPGTLDPVNGVLKLGRSSSAAGGVRELNSNANLTILAELEHAIKVNPTGFIESFGKARKFAMSAYDTVVGAKKNSGNECVERISCEFYQLARNYKMDKYVDLAFQRILPFKPKLNNVVSRIARGLVSDCHSYVCKPFFLAESQ